MSTRRRTKGEGSITKNSNNTYRLSLEETKAKIAALDYIKKELDGTGNFVQ